jgi:hypothetical protein
VIGADPSNNDAKMKLAEIYEIINEPRKALELVYEGNPWHLEVYTLVLIPIQLSMLVNRRNLLQEKTVPPQGLKPRLCSRRRPKARVNQQRPSHNTGLMLRNYANLRHKKNVRY